MEAIRPYILHLPSWYPNRYKPLEVSYLRDQISLLSTIKYGIVAAVIESSEIHTEEVEEITHDNHTELIKYIPLRRGPLRQLRYAKAHYQLAKSIISKYGRPDLVHVHIMWRAVIVAYLLHRSLGLKYIITEHDQIYLMKSKSVKRILILTFNNFLSKRARAVVAVSKSLYNELKVNALVTDMVYNPVNTEIFNIKNVVKNRDHYQFCHISHMNQDIKNPIGIMNSISKLSPNVKLKAIFVCSDNLNLDKASTAINKLDLHNSIMLTGLKSSWEISQIMKNSDILVMFSNVETFSIVIAEALCCGLPVIATKCGGPEELVNDSNGILVAPRDEEGLRKAMEAAMNRVWNHAEISINAQNKYGQTPYLDAYSKWY